jgi:hypothetical protein
VQEQDARARKRLIPQRGDAPRPETDHPSSNES